MTSCVSLEVIRVFSLQGHLGTWETIHQSFLIHYELSDFSLLPFRELYRYRIQPQSLADTSSCVSTSGDSPLFRLCCGF